MKRFPYLKKILRNSNDYTVLMYIQVNDRKTLQCSTSAKAEKKTTIFSIHLAMERMSLFLKKIQTCHQLWKRYNAMITFF